MRRFLPLLAVCLTAVAAAPAQAATTFFHSPSRNVSCALESSSVRCDIAKHSWRMRKPASCKLHYGDGLQVSATSRRGTGSCAGDTLIGTSGRSLAYGRHLTRGGITCTSASSGMTCRNRRGHGFRLAVGSYRLF